jgi:hypothetical protein
VAGVEVKNVDFGEATSLSGYNINLRSFIFGCQI